MPCCCLKILNLCSVPICGVLTLDVPAGAADSPSENNYTLVLDFLQTQITLSELQVEGENIHFNVSGLNENFQYIGKIYDPGGNLVTIADSPDTYDCIKFRTIMNLEAVPAGVLEDGVYRILE